MLTSFSGFSVMREAGTGVLVTIAENGDYVMCNLMDVKG